MLELLHGISLAESCRERLKKGSAVLVDGELQSRSWKSDDGHNRSIVEIKARRIQFLNRTIENQMAKMAVIAEEESIIMLLQMKTC